MNKLCIIIIKLGIIRNNIMITFLPKRQARDEGRVTFSSIYIIRYEREMNNNTLMMQRIKNCLYLRVQIKQKKGGTNNIKN